MSAGVIIDDSGLVVTTARSFLRYSDQGGRQITTDQIVIQFHNGFFTRGKLLGYDYAEDLAVVRFDPSNLDFRAADLADADLAVGDQVIAIGHPYFHKDTFAVGYVSSLTLNGVRATVDSVDETQVFAVTPFFRFDVAINPGNSGGMLANTDGEVLGIVFAQFDPKSAFDEGHVFSNAGGAGYGVATPIDIVMRVVDKILAGEKFFYGWLGVTGTESGLVSPDARYPGPRITRVHPGGPAHVAGIQVGDHVSEFEGKTLYTIDDLHSFVQFHPPGEYASIVLYRDGRRVEVSALIGTSSRWSSTVIT